ncbi:MAG: hypothetical protein JRJ10_07040 [Deltaproteobacteria bacterium]|nr:hypothetical protein [Deltaproteobacteria bacterium]
MAHARFIALLLLTIVGLVAGCGKEQAPVDRVGTNAVAKSFFQDSSWYFGRTVIDVDYEGGQLGTFPGDAALDFQGSDLASMPRIRWVIEEDSLLAFRDYELVEVRCSVSPLLRSRSRSTSTSAAPTPTRPAKSSTSSKRTTPIVRGTSATTCA